MDTTTQPPVLRMPGTPPRWINRLMEAALRTPGVRRLVGKEFALITVTGAVSGRRYTTPVQYLDLDGRTVVLSQRHRRWWRNIETVPSVTLLVRGATVAGTATVVSDGPDRDVLAACLERRPRVAEFYGVEMHDGLPDPAGVAALAERVVAIVIEPDRTESHSTSTEEAS